MLAAAGNFVDRHIAAVGEVPWSSVPKTPKIKQVSKAASKAQLKGDSHCGLVSPTK